MSSNYPPVVFTPEPSPVTAEIIGPFFNPLTGQPIWSGVGGKPFVTVTPNGPFDGGDFGPNTPNTITIGMQEAINSLGTIGGIVFVAHGSYTLPSTTNTEFIVIPDNVSVIGSGMDSTIINVPNQAQNFAPNLFRNSNLTSGNVGISISNLTISGNNNNTSTTQTDSGTAMLFIGVTNLRITNIKVKGMADTTILVSHEVDVGYTYPQSQNPLVSFDVEVTKCVLLSWGGGGFSAGNIIGLKFHHNYISATDTPVALGGGKQVTRDNSITFNDFDETGNNGEITLSSIAYNSPVITINAQNANSYSVLVAYNKIKTTVTPAIMAENHGSVGLNLYMDVIGNQIYGSGINAAFQIDPNCTGEIRFLNNFSYNVIGSAFYAPCIANGNYYENIEEIVICASDVTHDDNEINHASCNLTGGAISIAVNYGATTYIVGNTKIRRNHIFDNYTVPVLHKGIVFWSGGTNTGNNIIDDNVIENASSSPYITGFSANDFIRRNFGYNPLGSVIPSANPLVSGTVYQNTSGVDVDIYVPISFGTAGTAQASIGATSTPSIALPQESEPATSIAGIIKNVIFHVPAGWYYKVVVSGTATTIQSGAVIVGN